MKEFLYPLIVRYFELFICGWGNKLFYVFGKSGLPLESSSRKIFLLCYWKKVGYVMSTSLQTEVSNRRNNLF